MFALSCTSCKHKLESMIIYWQQMPVAGSEVASWSKAAVYRHVVPFPHTHSTYCYKIWYAYSVTHRTVVGQILCGISAWMSSHLNSVPILVDCITTLITQLNYSDQYDIGVEKVARLKRRILKKCMQHGVEVWARCKINNFLSLPTDYWLSFAQITGTDWKGRDCADVHFGVQNDTDLE